MTINAGDLEVRFKAQTQQLEQAMRKTETNIKKMMASINRANKKVSQSSKQTNEALKKNQKAASDLGGTIRKLAGGYLSLQAAMNGMQAAKNYAYFADSKAVFEQMGYNLEQFRTATKGLIDDQTLVQKANLAQNMGITGKEFQELANIADAAAKKTGQSQLYMFESIVTGTARSSRLILDNLGIMVDWTAAHEKHARTLKKTVKEMTDQEKKQAEINHVLEKGREMMNQVNDGGATLGDTFDKMEAAMKNLYLETGKSLMPAMQSAANFFTDLSNEIIAAKSNFGDLILEYGKFKPESMTSFFGSLPANMLGALSGLSKEEIQRGALDLSGANNEQSRLAAVTKKIRERLAEIDNSILVRTTQGLTDGVEWDELLKKQAKLKNALELSMAAETTFRDRQYKQLTMRKGGEDQPKKRPGKHKFTSIGDINPYDLLESDYLANAPTTLEILKTASDFDAANAEAATKYVLDLINRNAEKRKQYEEKEAQDRERHAMELARLREDAHRAHVESNQRALGVLSSVLSGDPVGSFQGIVSVLANAQKKVGTKMVDKIGGAFGDLLRGMDSTPIVGAITGYLGMIFNMAQGAVGAIISPLTSTASGPMSSLGMQGLGSVGSTMGAFPIIALFTSVLGPLNLVIQPLVAGFLLLTGAVVGTTSMLITLAQQSREYAGLQDAQNAAMQPFVDMLGQGMIRPLYAFVAIMNRVTTAMAGFFGNFFDLSNEIEFVFEGFRMGVITFLQIFDVVGQGFLHASNLVVDSWSQIVGALGNFLTFLGGAMNAVIPDSGNALFTAGAGLLGSAGSIGGMMDPSAFHQQMQDLINGITEVPFEELVVEGEQLAETLHELNSEYRNVPTGYKADAAEWAAINAGMSSGSGGGSGPSAGGGFFGTGGPLTANAGPSVTIHTAYIQTEAPAGATLADANVVKQLATSGSATYTSHQASSLKNPLTMGLGNFTP